MSGLMLNEDNSHFYSFHALEEMTSAGLDAWADQYAGTQVREIVLCLNSQRSSAPTAARQTVWDGYDPQAGLDQPFFAGVPDGPLWPGGPQARQHMRHWVHHAYHLYATGIDPYERWLRRFRRHGISPRLSIRMNDVHYVDQPAHCIHDRFWREHPEFRRCPATDGYNGNALDYGRPEVRAYALAYLREMIARYDADGFELDWMRNPYHFRPGEEEAGGRLLTEFMGEARRLTRARGRELGHAVGLSARVPSRPDTARALGLDVGRWAREGLIDAVTVTPFLYSEFDLPLDAWRRILGERGIVLAAGLECTAGLWRDDKIVHTLETARGAAAGFLHGGADRVYVFNLMDNYPLGITSAEYRRSPAGQAYACLLREVGDPATLAGRSRRHLFRWPDTYGPGECPADSLPRVCPAGTRTAFRVTCGPAPGAGQRAQARLATDPAAEGMCAVWLNQTPCPASGPVAFATRGLTQADGFTVPDGVVQEGANVVEVRNVGAAPLQLTWLEIAVSDTSGQWAAPGDLAAQPFYPG